MYNPVALDLLIDVTPAVSELKTPTLEPERQAWQPGESLKADY